MSWLWKTNRAQTMPTILACCSCLIRAMQRFQWSGKDLKEAKFWIMMNRITNINKPLLTGKLSSNTSRENVTSSLVANTPRKRARSHLRTLRLKAIKIVTLECPKVKLFSQILKQWAKISPQQQHRSKKFKPRKCQRTMTVSSQAYYAPMRRIIIIKPRKRRNL